MQLIKQSNNTYIISRTWNSKMTRFVFTLFHYVAIIAICAVIQLEMLIYSYKQ